MRPAASWGCRGAHVPRPRYERPAQNTGGSPSCHTPERSGNDPTTPAGSPPPAGASASARPKTAPVGAWGHRRVLTSQGGHDKRTHRATPPAYPDVGILTWGPPWVAPGRPGTAPAAGPPAQVGCRRTVFSALSPGTHREMPGRRPGQRGLAESTTRANATVGERGETQAKAEVYGAQGANAPPGTRLWDRGGPGALPCGSRPCGQR